MDNQDEILAIVRRFVREAIRKDSLRDDDDLFDAGATSLTVVDLQLRIEERLNRQTSTHQLMAASTIREWAQIYSAVQPQRATSTNYTTGA